MQTNPVTGFDFNIISTDGHVQPLVDELVARMPEDLRGLAPGPIYIDGEEYRNFPGLAPISKAFAENIKFGVDTDQLETFLEFRNDPAGGRDLAVRKAQLELDGVWGEVVFPNFLSLGAHPSAAFQREIGRLYNDMCAEIFLAEESDRYAPAAVLSTIDPLDAVREAERARSLGFVCVMMPPVVPWLPYWHQAWEPLWSALEQLELVLNFHVFSGNTAQGVDFGNLWVIPPDLEMLGRARFRAERVDERLSTTVMCMASAMSPMTHLIGSGTLDRHPNLRFALVESEAGWIPWSLQALDLMQKRRRFAMINLQLQPSDYFRRQGWGTFLEDRVAVDALEYIGEDRLMWSNDWPHDEGTYLRSQKIIGDIMGHLRYDVKRKLLRDNAAALYHLDQQSETALEVESARVGVGRN